MNKVQIAYIALTVHVDTLDRLDTSNLEAVDQYFKKESELARGVYYAVNELTAKINPSLKADIERGHFDDFYLYSSHICFLDANWQIMPDGHKCAHCGKTHTADL